MILYLYADWEFMSIQTDHTIRHGKTDCIEHHHVASVDELVIDLIMSVCGRREGWIQEDTIRAQQIQKLMFQIVGNVCQFTVS